MHAIRLVEVSDRLAAVRHIQFTSDGIRHGIEETQGVGAVACDELPPVMGQPPTLPTIVKLICRVQREAVVDKADL